MNCHPDDPSLWKTMWLISVARATISETYEKTEIEDGRVAHRCWDVFHSSLARTLAGVRKHSNSSKEAIDGQHTAIGDILIVRFGGESGPTDHLNARTVAHFVPPKRGRVIVHIEEHWSRLRRLDVTHNNFWTDTHFELLALWEVTASNDEWWKTASCWADDSELMAWSR